MYKRRVAIIDLKKCRPKLCGEVCIGVCPMVRMSKKAIYNENDQIIIDEEVCNGCGICVHKCPYDALKIINLELNLDNPVHQYGENRFRLFRFLNITENKNIGVIGPNGIGKSTIIKILAGSLIPNLGNYDKNVTYEKVIDSLKGKELQKYFIKLKDKKLCFAYKPQNIETIPLAFSEKVKELLKKADANNNLDKIVEDLQIDGILDRSISVLSGGELQKVAIAATMLKNAEISFYDEPTSFLDIKQRFLFSNLIQAQQNTNIIIEHDLAILDYISDFVHIIFGEPHAYGIISNVKTTNVGINEFLDGFIKDENIRFRNSALELQYNPTHTKTKELILEYDEKQIKLGDFTLEYSAGKIFSNQIIGILGENGTGKTTFIKSLVDDYKENKKITCVYKPQSLMLNKEDSEKTVLEYFKGVNAETLSSILWDKLHLEKIKTYKLKELNGGDLQKVLVSKVLATDANIYLLDEPSAFLDVEERINIAKAIRNIMYTKNKVAFVVDHDIVFMDYISDSLLIFEGKPGLNCKTSEIMPKKEGMNKFLKILGITYRKDPVSKRPRINKMDSTKDKEQKQQNQYYIY